MSETIQLEGVGKRKGPRMPRKIYKQLADGILQCITESEKGNVNLDELLEHMKIVLGEESRHHLPGSLLLVKNDLKSKEIVSISFDVNRNQNITLNKVRYYGV